VFSLMINEAGNFAFTVCIYTLLFVCPSLNGARQLENPSQMMLLKLLKQQTCVSLSTSDVASIRPN